MNIFSYQYGTVFTGKQIKDFLKEWESKGHSMYRLRQYERCEDDELYKLAELPGTCAGERYKGFVRIKKRKEKNNSKYEKVEIEVDNGGN